MKILQLRAKILRNDPVCLAIGGGSSARAWLVCGYKRNGLDAWRKISWSGEKHHEKTLHQVLAEIESPKSRSHQ